MMSQKDVDRACQKALSEVNLLGGCREFVKSCQLNSPDVSAQYLEQLIRVSISRCIYAVLNKS